MISPRKQRRGTRTAAGGDIAFDCGEIFASVIGSLATAYLPRGCRPALGSLHNVRRVP